MDNNNEHRKFETNNNCNGVIKKCCLSNCIECYQEFQTIRENKKLYIKEYEKKISKETKVLNMVDIEISKLKL